jgi:hypothetical protein
MDREWRGEQVLVKRYERAHECHLEMLLGLRVGHQPSPPTKGSNWPLITRFVSIASVQAPGRHG